MTVIEKKSTYDKNDYKGTGQGFKSLREQWKTAKETKKNLRFMDFVESKK